MKPKLILCLALVLSGGLCGCATHGISLSRSEDQIRTSILKITPLGTPIEDVKTSIHTKLHPDTFYYYEHGGNLPDIIRDGKVIPGQWPLGGEHHGKEIGCQIGQIGIPLLNAQDIDADWAFDDKDRLADVFVYKTADEP